MKYYNHKTRITAATLGTLLGLAGCINHGIFEIMQGNTPTNGLFIYATRIDKPLSWWRRVLSTAARNVLAKLWKPMLVLTALSWVTVMELGIFGYFPGQADPDVLLNITFGFVLLTVVLANVTFVCAFAGDIGQNEART